MHGFHTADEGWCWTNGASNIIALGYCSRSALHDLQSGALFCKATVHAVPCMLISLFFIVLFCLPIYANI